jgi:signal transduction histidine kinase
VSSILDEMLVYVGFDAGDRERLSALHDRLAPEFPAIAVAFYDAVFKNEGATSILKGPEQIERLRVTLIDWMSTGLRGPYDGAFHEKRSRIGRRHVLIGLPQRYMFTSMNVVRQAYTDRIAAMYPPTEAIAVLKSLDKLFDIELALMLRHYQLESEEKRAAAERSIHADRILALQTLTAGLAHEVRNPLNASPTDPRSDPRPAQRARESGDRATDGLAQRVPRVRARSAAARSQARCRCHRAASHRSRETIRRSSAHRADARAGNGRRARACRSGQGSSDHSEPRA